MAFFDEMQIRVRYAETDQMGVVHHANYALYLETARIQWLRKHGFSYKEMESEGVMLPVASIFLKYKKSAYFDDVLTVKTYLKNTPNVKIEFDYEIANQHNDLIVTASTVLVFIDAKTKRPIKCPEYLLEALT